MISTRLLTSSKKIILKLNFSVVALSVFAILWGRHSFASQAQSSDYPVYISQVQNLNDYSLFANSGWDGNWYVGYNNGWVKKLPSPPKANYARAFIGAKLGRAKTLPAIGRPPQFNPVPGEIWESVADAPSWKKNQRYKLATTEDIPMDGSSEYALDNTGESEWLWTEVPVKDINFSGDNYLALWSPTPYLLSVSSSPVLAAAWGGNEINTWLTNNIQGAPPSDPKTALKTGISFFQPAIAIKLIPAGNPHPMRVRMIGWQNGTPDHLKPIVTASVEGESVERVWVEYNSAVRRGDVVRGGSWSPIGRSLWKAPYMFSLDQAKLPHGKLLLRVAAVNIWEEKYYSDPFEIEISPLDAKK